MSALNSAYENWTKEELIARLRHLDEHCKTQEASHSYPYAHPHHLRLRPHPQRHTNGFKFAAHPKRKIALKFCYHGQHYSGMEFQFKPNPLPTVEGTLFNALAYKKLVDPEGGLEGCGWERCGRTDRGVSAAQQVVSLWVRSAIGEMNLENEEKPDVLENSSTLSETTEGGEEEGPGLEGDLGFVADWDEPPTDNCRRPPSRGPSQELEYVALLNTVLPPTIRVIAWSPVSPDFSARFHCRHRHYKYFFTSDGLDVLAMQDAADRLVGEHDFRNMCKMDPRKQLTHFVRRIKSATISPVSKELSPSSNMYVFDLIGTAFLYNQVRHIMALLFLVGTHLEHPFIINALMNTDPANPLPPYRPDEPAPPLVLTKPDYQMADPFPLVLWDCVYEDGQLNWQVEPDTPFPETGLPVTNYSARLHDIMHGLHTRSLIQTALDSHFLNIASAFHSPSPQYLPLRAPGTQPIPQGETFGYPLGAATFKRAAKYLPILERPRMASAEEVNERWRLGRGRKQWERRLEKKAAYEAAANGTSVQTTTEVIDVKEGYPIDAQDAGSGLSPDIDE